MAARPNLNKDVAGFYDLLKAVDRDNPKKSEIAELRKSLRETPQLWRAVGDMAHSAATHMIDTMNAPQSMKLSLQQGWESLQNELAVPDSTPLEQLLIQQVVLAWLRLSYVEYAYTTVTDGSATYEKLNYWEKRLNASQRRFLRACETLVRIRRFNLPAIQLNIGRQQVNQVNSR